AAVKAATSAAGGHKTPPISSSHANPDVPAGQGGLRPASKKAALRRGRHAAKNFVLADTYEDLTTLVDAAARWDIKLLIIVGPPGCGKSQIVRAAFGPDALYLRGRVTPMRMYIRLYQHRRQAAVFDDLDTLIADRLALGLLLELCETNGERTVSWQTTSKLL